VGRSFAQGEGGKHEVTACSAALCRTSAKSGPRRGGNLDAALTPRTEDKSMRKAVRTQTPIHIHRNSTAPARREA
jgi:hypothetical protein